MSFAEISLGGLSAVLGAIGAAQGSPHESMKHTEAWQMPDAYSRLSSYFPQPSRLKKNFFFMTTSFDLLCVKEQWVDNGLLYSNFQG